MGEERQATFGEDGDIETDRPPEATGTNDFGERKDSDETDGGYNRYAVSSLLQKAVRRSDEEVAAWAAWELARSGFGWHLWDRLNRMVVEDLQAGATVALTVERYEELGTERYDPDSAQGRQCAIHGALACARARSTREATHADTYFTAVADHRAAVQERGEDPDHEFPVEELEPGGRHDVALDGHTAEGSRLGRDAAFFRVHASRVGPEGEDDPSARWKRQAMRLEDEAYEEKAIEHALAPVDPANRWAEPDDP